MSCAEGHSESSVMASFTMPMSVGATQYGSTPYRFTVMVTERDELKMKEYIERGSLYRRTEGNYS